MSKGIKDSCKSKVKHPSYRCAEGARKRMRHLREGARLQTYKCQYCDGYHIGRRKPPPLPSWVVESNDLQKGSPKRMRLGL